MSGLCVRPACLIAAGTIAALAIGAAQVRAQTQLPGITVITPSPVAKPAPPEAPAPPPTGLIIEDAFVPLTIVPSEQIAGTPGATLTDALQTKPGIIGSTFAPGANRPVIRGFDNFRVLVQEGGIGSHGVSALSEDHAVPIDPGIIGRIEVVRGPATLRYGSRAIGGVVNAITSRIPEIVPPNGISLETRGGFSSVDRGSDGVFKVSAGSGTFVVYADAFKRHAGDYDTPLGRQFNTFGTMARVWKGVWGIDARYDFVHASFDDAEGGIRLYGIVKLN